MYKLIANHPIFGESTTLIRTTDNAFIPKDPANTDYQKYLEWVAEGNEPEPAE